MNQGRWRGWCPVPRCPRKSLPSWRRGRSSGDIGADIVVFIRRLVGVMAAHQQGPLVVFAEHDAQSREGGVRPCRGGSAGGRGRWQRRLQWGTGLGPRGSKGWRHAGHIEEGKYSTPLQAIMTWRVKFFQRPSKYCING
jgi:hypothetical protein